MQLIGADQGVCNISHTYRYTLQYLQDLEKPIEVISETIDRTRNIKGNFFIVYKCAEMLCSL